MALELNKKTFLLITGASRGIGKTMAIKLAAKLKEGSVILLLARNAENLAETKAEIEKLNMAHKVLTYAIDLATAKAEDFQQLLHQALVAIGEPASNFDRAFIIHNAGSVGDVSKRAIDVADTDVWTRYYHLNFFSVVSLNCEFFRAFVGVPKIVVNLSSKCGIEPFASMSAYCSGKAARDMYFRVLAVEEASDTIVLNYAPGAINTDMSVQVEKESFNEQLTSTFKQARITETMLTTEETTRKFLQVLEEHKFQSGDHVDYWDD